jgi:hypothetical protein
MYEAHMPEEKHDELPELLKKCARIQPAWHTATAETSLCDIIAPLVLPLLLLLHPVVLHRCVSCSHKGFCDIMIPLTKNARYHVACRYEGKEVELLALLEEVLEQTKTSLGITE